MLASSEFLILLIITLAMVTLVNPLILLEGFKKLLKRQRGVPSLREIERKLFSYHQKSLEKMEEQIQTQVREELAKIASKHLEMLAKLGADREIKDAVEKYLEETKLALTGLVAKAEKRVDEELNQELAEAHGEIDAYREKRLKKIDDEIVRIVERTIYQTLGKGLNLEDQIDTIYEALAEAKEEGFFGKNAK